MNQYVNCYQGEIIVLLFCNWMFTSKSKTIKNKSTLSNNICLMCGTTISNTTRHRSTKKHIEHYKPFNEQVENFIKDTGCSNIKKNINYDILDKIIITSIKQVNVTNQKKRKLTHERDTKQSNNNTAVALLNLKFSTKYAVKFTADIQKDKIINDRYIKIDWMYDNKYSMTIAKSYVIKNLQSTLTTGEKTEEFIEKHKNELHQLQGNKVASSFYTDIGCKFEFKDKFILTVKRFEYTPMYFPTFTVSKNNIELPRMIYVDAELSPCMETYTFNISTTPTIINKIKKIIKQNEITGEWAVTYWTHHLLKKQTN